MTSSSVSRSPSHRLRRLDQRAGQVVARRTTPLVDHVLVVADQPERRVHRGRRHVVDAVLAVHDDVGLAAYLRAVLLGDAHHLGDDVHRELAGEVGDPVEAAHLQALGEVAVGQLLDPRQQVVDAARGEAAGDEGAQPLLARRVHAEDRHHLVRVRAPGRLLDRDAPGVGVGALGADRLGDVGVPGQRPQVEGRVVVQRLVLAQPGVDRVGVLLEGVVVRVQRQRLAGDRSCVAPEDRGHHGVEAVGQVVVGDQSHPGLQQRAGQGEGQGVEELGRPRRRRAPSGTGR